MKTIIYTFLLLLFSSCEVTEAIVSIPEQELQPTCNVRDFGAKATGIIDENNLYN